MSMRIGALDATATHAAATAATEKSASPTSAATDPKKAQLHKAAQEFEAIFMRQLLSSMKFGGQDAKQGYGSMAVDAMAQGLSSNGGMGLAKQIERAVEAAQRHPTHPTSK